MEDVDVVCRNAVVLMLHCHVALEAVFDSIKCEHVTGVVSVPCCEPWNRRQSIHQGRAPDQKYDDKCMLTEMREVRLWGTPRSAAPMEGVEHGPAVMRWREGGFLDPRKKPALGAGWLPNRNRRKKIAEVPFLGTRRYSCTQLVHTMPS